MNIVQKSGLVLSFIFLLAVSATYLLLNGPKAPTNEEAPAIISVSYPTMTYFHANQKGCGCSVKTIKMSVFLNAISQTDNIKSSVLSVNPLGTMEIVDGEPAYAGVVVTHLAR